MYGFEDYEEQQNNCCHKGGRDRKWDGGNCPLLCSDCRLIVGWWELAPGASIESGRYKYTEWVNAPYGDTRTYFYQAGIGWDA